MQCKSSFLWIYMLIIFLLHNYVTHRRWVGGLSPDRYTCVRKLFSFKTNALQGGWVGEKRPILALRNYAMPPYLFKHGHQHGQTWIFRQDHYMPPLKYSIFFQNQMIGMGASIHLWTYLACLLSGGTNTAILLVWEAPEGGLNPHTNQALHPSNIRISIFKISPHTGHSFEEMPP